MAWMVTYDKLDGDQKHFVDREIEGSENLWVQGLAGSGKSILLVHALLKKLEDEDECKVCIIVFTRALVDMFRTGMNELGLSSSIPILTPYEFLKSGARYDYIFCDEVQDLPASTLRAMKARCEQLFVAGDSNQSIYDIDPRSKEPVVNPNQIGELVAAKPYPLTRIYRLTRSIIQIIEGLLPDLGIFNANVDMTKKDVSVRLCKAYDEEEEVKYIDQLAKEATSVKESAVVLFPTKNAVEKFAQILLETSNKPKWTVTRNFGSQNWGDLNSHLARYNLKVEYVGSGYGSFQNAERERNIILMTYHSAKGLDFDNVYVPFLSSNLNIKDKTLLMVALTRSKFNLYLTYSGYLHDYVEEFEKKCTKIDIGNSQTGGTAEDLGDIFDF
jgi:superfamily I DNA/RNA helicase